MGNTVSVIAFIARNVPPLETALRARYPRRFPLQARLRRSQRTAAGHVKGMNVPARFYANPELLKLVSNEFRTAGGGFTGAVQQLANVATLPGVCC